MTSASSSVDALEQDADHALRWPTPERPADRRAAQVGLDQDHAIAGGGERGGEVDRGGRLALRRRGAGDQDRPRAVAGCRAGWRPGSRAGSGRPRRRRGRGRAGSAARSPGARSRAGSGRGSAGGRGAAAAPRAAAAGRGSGARRRRRSPRIRPASSPPAMLSFVLRRRPATVGSAAWVCDPHRRVVGLAAAPGARRRPSARAGVGVRPRAGARGPGGCCRCSRAATRCARRRPPRRTRWRAPVPPRASRPRR